MPVWFPAPEPQGVLIFSRTLHVPAGAWVFASGPNVATFSPPGERTEEQMKADLEPETGNFLSCIKSVESTIDGVPLPDIKTVSRPDGSLHSGPASQQPLQRHRDRR
jgi:hypothetical protein